LALINPRTIGTGRPNTGKALEVGIEAFQRVDRMAREAAAAKQASKEKLGSYTPEIDGVWAKDLAEVRGDLEQYRETNINAWVAGNDPYDPLNTDAFKSRANSEGNIDSKIVASKQHRELFTEAAATLNEKGTEVYDPESYARLEEFADAPDIWARQEILDKYGGNLLVERPFDVNAYAKSLIPAGVERTEQLRGQMAGTYEQRTTTEVTDEQVMKAARGVVRGDQRNDRLLLEAAQKVWTSYSDPERQALEADAQAAGMSPEEYSVFHFMDRFRPDPTYTSVFKSLPSRGNTINIGNGKKEEDYSLVAMARMMEFAEMATGKGNGWVKVGDATPPLTGAAYRMHPVHGGMKVGTVKVNSGGSIVSRGSTSITDEGTLKSMDNNLEKFIEYNGQVYFMTTESRMSWESGGNRMGVQLPGIGSGFILATDQEMEQLLLDMSKYDPEFKEEDGRKIAAAFGAVDGHGHINWTKLSEMPAAPATDGFFGAFGVGSTSGNNQSTVIPVTY
jgi:hypothetical protein